MRFSETWLREWVDPPIDTEALCARLSMAGLEVDAVDPVAAPFSGIVAGHIRSIGPHPQADRLRICQIDVGEAEPLAIVTNATNVVEGMCVPVARVDAVLADGTRIKLAKLRGVDSPGMLCSGVELGIAEESAGILALPANIAPGTDVRSALGLDDHSIELDLTPNRADCLGVAGIAREIGALTESPVREAAVAAVDETIADRFDVRVDAKAACPRYLGRVVRGIDPRAPTPLWITERLRRSGLRSLGAAVDVTNYVLLELGQPMHAFDLGKLAGGVVVRAAGEGEALELLNGQSVNLRRGTLVIADHARPLALAGVMGGAGSAVTDATTDVFLECAFFAPEHISGVARSYGLATDSSHRFERGVDPALQLRAMQRATELLTTIAGGRVGPIVEVSSAEAATHGTPIALRAERIGRLLGIEIPADAVVGILGRLGMQVATTATGWNVRAPSWRFDIAIEADLIEELARVYGYDRIPAAERTTFNAAATADETRLDLVRVRQRLIARGWQEVVTYSFVAPKLLARLAPALEAVELANPLSAEMSVMRTSLLPGLVSTAQYNRNRQQERLRIFESGLCFRREAGAIVQSPMLGGLLAGAALPEQWAAADTGADVFDLKAEVEAILAFAGGAAAYRFEPWTGHAALHPGRTARILRAAEPIGWIGTLHPALAGELDLPGACVFEFELDRLAPGRRPSYASLSKFPAIRLDLAMIVPRGTAWEALAATVRATAGSRLQALNLFDVYAGDKIEVDKKSLAFSLILQDFSRTLTDDDVAAVRASVVGRCREEHGAELRG
ncbi:MAG: phenylalanine--tRNA ligase subunit beta [Chromatiales bacterium]|nr:phenylalanine--tRNA ligase subunit beta [Chromatiales bacterium]